MRLWAVNGISQKGNEFGGIGMHFVAVTEAEAIGLTYREMEKAAPGWQICKVWATDVTDWARAAVAGLPE